MKKASQIVFLVDVDCIVLDSAVATAPGGQGRKHVQDSDEGSSGDGENEILTNGTLHRICLRFLSYFAAQQQQQQYTTSSSSTLVRWGYKFYRSRSTNAVHQRYQFRDLDVQSLTQFAIDLEGQLRRCRDASDSYTTQLQLSSSLERAIRELICDFPWDSPYISSPVKVKKASSQHPGDGSSSVDNYVILITELPSSSDELHEFLGTSPPQPVSSSPDESLSIEPAAVCWPTVKQILQCISPPNVRQLMCNVAKIRLLWLDAIPLCYNTVQKVQYGQQVKHTFELVHEALTTIGGGIVPLGTVLLHDTLCDGFGKSVVTCHRFHFPESYRLRAPFASVLSVYSNYLEIPAASSEYSCDAVLDVPSTSDGNAHHRKYGVQLLPLFRKLTCPHVNDAASMSVCTCGANPRLLKAVGTMTLSDMRTHLAVETKAYICCPNEADAGFDFQDLLDDLCTDDKALVVSGQKSCVGLLVPANDDACIAVLYMLIGKAQSLPDFSSGAGATDVVDLVFKFMTPWKTKASSCRFDSDDSAANFLNRWLQEESDGDRKMNKVQEELIRKLQKSHRSSVKPSDQNDNNRRRSPRLLKKPIHRPTNSTVAKSLSFSDILRDCDRRRTRSDDKANGELQPIGEKGDNLDVKDLENHDALLDYVQKIYKAASHGERAVVGAAQDIVRTVLQFYGRRASGTTPAKNESVRFLVRDVFRSSKDLTMKHRSTSEPSKNIRVQETYLQIVTRLEMQQNIYGESRDFEELVDEITLLLRSLSFVAGPSVLSAFLRETLIKNYYDSLRDVVRAICDELNQPCTDERPDDDSDDSLGSTSAMPVLSNMTEVEQADDASSSMFSQLSETSSFSASSNSCKSRISNRRSHITQHHSFVSMSRKRQIIVPRVIVPAPSNEAEGRSITGSVKVACKSQHRSCMDGEEQRSVRRRHQQHRHTSRTGVGSPATNKHITPQKRHRLTTPKGRHVLKTKKVAETPVSRQVSHVTLARQRNKRKLISDDDDDVADNDISCNDVIAETPEKLIDERLFRRSPRQHASSLERRASFYSSESQSRNLTKAESNVHQQRASERLMSQEDDVSTPSNKHQQQQQKEKPNSVWSTETPQRVESLCLDVNTSPVKLMTPKSRSKSRVKRHLNLSNLFSPDDHDDDNCDTETRYKNPRKRLHRSRPDEDEDHETRSTNNDDEAATATATTALTRSVTDRLFNGTEVDVDSLLCSPSRKRMTEDEHDVACDDHDLDDDNDDACERLRQSERGSNEDRRTRSMDNEDDAVICSAQVVAGRFQDGLEMDIDCRSPSPPLLVSFKDDSCEDENRGLPENVVCEDTVSFQDDEARVHENSSEQIFESEDHRASSSENEDRVLAENGIELDSGSRSSFKWDCSEVEPKDMSDAYVQSSSLSPTDDVLACHDNVCGHGEETPTSVATEAKLVMDIEEDHRACPVKREQDIGKSTVLEPVAEMEIAITAKSLPDAEVAFQAEVVTQTKVETEAEDVAFEEEVTMDAVANHQTCCIESESVVTDAEVVTEAEIATEVEIVTETEIAAETEVITTEAGGAKKEAEVVTQVKDVMEIEDVTDTEVMKDAIVASEAATVMQVEDVAEVQTDIGTQPDDVTDVKVMEQIENLTKPDIVLAVDVVKEVEVVTETENISETKPESEAEVMRKVKGVTDAEVAMQAQVVKEDHVEAEDGRQVEVLTETNDVSETEVVTEAESVTEVNANALESEEDDAVMEVIMDCVTQAVTQVVTQVVMEALTEVATQALAQVITEAVTQIELNTDHKDPLKDNGRDEPTTHPTVDVSCVMSSPLRNGRDSPTETCVTDSMPFPCGGGPLAATATSSSSSSSSSDGATSCSRSSSPGIPFLWPEVDFGYRQDASSTIAVEDSVWSDDDDDDGVDLGHTSHVSPVTVPCDNGLPLNGDIDVVEVKSMQSDPDPDRLCYVEWPMQVDQGSPSPLNLSKVCFPVDDADLPGHIDRFEHGLARQDVLGPNQRNEPW